MRRTLVLAPWLSGLRPSAGSLTTGCIRLGSKRRPSLSFLRPLSLLQAWVASYGGWDKRSSLLASPRSLSPYLRFGCLFLPSLLLPPVGPVQEGEGRQPRAQPTDQGLRAGQSACREAFLWLKCGHCPETVRSRPIREVAEPSTAPTSTPKPHPASQVELDRPGLRARRPGWQSCQQGGEG